jgi:hypothetical protein
VTDFRPGVMPAVGIPAMTETHTPAGRAHRLPPAWIIEVELHGQLALERVIAIFRVRGLTILWLEYQPGSAGSSDILKASTAASREQAERVLAYLERVVTVTTVRIWPAGSPRSFNDKPEIQ